MYTIYTVMPDQPISASVALMTDAIHGDHNVIVRLTGFQGQADFHLTRADAELLRDRLIDFLGLPVLTEVIPEDLVDPRESEAQNDDSFDSEYERPEDRCPPREW